MSIIEDGRGTGNKARVGNTNRLDVASEISERIYYVSKFDGKAFVVNLALTQASGGTSEGLGYITYTGDDYLFLRRIILSTEESSGMTKFGIWLNPTTLSGGVAKTAVNLNTASAISSETTIVHNNDTTAVTISGGDSVYTLRLQNNSSFIVNFDDALILGKNKSIGLKASADTTGAKIRATVMFYEESSGLL